METEIFRAFDVKCPHCKEYISLRTSLEESSIHYCKECKKRLHKDFLLAERVQKRAVQCFSFDCNNCGMENISNIEPSMCKFCKEKLTNRNFV